MIKIEIDNAYPSSSMVFETWTDDDGYDWEQPYIALNESQIVDFSTRFGISSDEAKEIIVAHEMGHCKAWELSQNYKDEELAWNLAPEVSLPNEKVAEIREYCLKSYV